MTGKLTDPARGDLGIAPAQRLGRVDAHHEMQVIAHHRIGIDRDGEAAGNELDAVFDPAPAMLEGLAAVVIDAAEEGPSDSALDAMEGAGAVQRCDVGAGPGHASVLLGRGWQGVGELLMGV